MNSFKSANLFYKPQGTINVSSDIRWLDYVLFFFSFLALVDFIKKYVLKFFFGVKQFRSRPRFSELVLGPNCLNRLSADDKINDRSN